jgi:hypothetical protein
LGEAALDAKKFQEVWEDFLYGLAVLASHAGVAAAFLVVVFFVEKLNHWFWGPGGLLVAGIVSLDDVLEAADVGIFLTLLIVGLIKVVRQMWI